MVRQDRAWWDGIVGGGEAGQGMVGWDSGGGEAGQGMVGWDSGRSFGLAHILLRLIWSV